MTTMDRDRELLVEFCAYCDGQPQEEALDDRDLIDAFIASRQPQGAPAPELRCDTCRHDEGVRTFPSAPPLAMGCPSRGFCEEYEGWEPVPPTAEQRYWRVVTCPGQGKHPTGPPAFMCWNVDATGELFSHVSTCPRPTREQAEADGAASGLEPWNGGGKSTTPP